MRVFYVGRKYRTNAVGEYDTHTGRVTVLKGSVVSESIAAFKNTETVKKLREQYVNEEGTLMQDVIFNSPSSAAMFVTGYSADGLLTWHVEKHKTLKTFLQELKEV